MDKLIIKLSAQMLDEYKEELTCHGHNDYEIEATEENIKLVKDMIAKSDYPEDNINRQIRSGKIHIMDWKLACYLRNQLLRMAGNDK